MSELIRIYLDEDVNVLVAEMLRARGLDVLTTRDANNLGASDDLQLTYAAIRGRIFLTHNRVDFEKLAIQSFERALAEEDTLSHHAGIVIAYRRPPRELTIKILQSLKGLTTEKMVDQVLYI